MANCLSCARKAASTGAKKLAEVGAAELLPEIAAVECDDATHFMQPRTHALPNAIAQGLCAAGCARGRYRSGHSGGGLVVKIRGDDGGAIVVVARVQDQA